MSTAENAWGDDLLAVAEAVGVVAPSGRPYLTAPGTLLDLVPRLAAAADQLDDDQPVPYLVTDHDVCHGCAEVLCGCEDQCPDLERDVCSHDGRQYCPGCAAHHCAYCRADEDRWGRC